MSRAALRCALLALPSTARAQEAGKPTLFGTIPFIDPRSGTLNVRHGDKPSKQ